MSVVLRCPNCGTTRATPGECEACQQGPVRYFCTNHAPGLWLSERSCAKCGAAFGEPSRAPSPPPARSPAPAPVAGPRREPVPAAPVASASRSAARSRYPRAEHTAVYDEAPEPSVSTMAPWQKVLSAALRARSAAIAARDPRRLPVGVGGCLRRVLVTVVLLFVAFGIALFVFGRALLQTLQP